METVQYQILGSKVRHEFDIMTTIDSFKKSSDPDNYSKYGFPFSISLFRYLMKVYDGIQPLSLSQYELLEERYNVL